MTEKFANAAQTTLASAMLVGDLTLSVASAALFPTSGTFRLIIGSELLTVTSVSGTTFTVTRGAEGSVAAAHASASLVTAIITAAALEQLKTDATGASFTAPTGSGLMTVTSSAMDAASKPVGTGFYTWVATPSSANLAALVTDETGTGALVFGTAPLFKTTINLNNPGDTAKYVVTPAAIAADRILNLPLLTATDTVAVLAFAQTLTNKTINAADNTITDTSAALGDLLYHNGTRFVRLPRGTANQVLTTNAGATDISWAAAAGGGISAPTGTGFGHSTAGSWDAASKKVVLTDAADVTVPATANGVITSSGTVLQQAINVLAGSNYVSIGSTPATGGSLRFTEIASTKTRRYDNAADVTVWQTNGSDQLFIGAADGSSTEPMYSVHVLPSSLLQLGIAGTVLIAIDATTAVKIGTPVIGNGAPYGVHGVGIQAMVDADKTLSSLVYCYGTIRTTGANTADHTLTVPAATDAASFTKDYENACTGAFDVIVSNGGGTTVRIASGCKKTLRSDAGGIVDTSELAGPVTSWGTTSPLRSFKAELSTTGATLTTIATYPIPASTIVDFQITIVALRTGGVSGTAGDSYRAEMPVTYQRIASAGPTLVGAAYAILGAKSNGGGSAYLPSLDISGNDLRVRVTGVATTNINWTVTVQGQQCT